MNHYLNSLISLTKTMKSCTNERVIETTIIELKSKAHEYGYSYSYFEKHGVWVPYSELETYEKYELHETRIKANNLELNQTEADSITQLTCPNCSTIFEPKLKSQVYCKPACKVAYNNSKKRKFNE